MISMFYHISIFKSTLCITNHVPLIQIPLDPGTVELVIETALWLFEHSLGESASIFWLIEDVLEIITIDESEKIFDMSDSKMDRMMVV